MDAVVKPEAIETFSTPGVERTVVRTGARLSDIGFRVGYQRQLRRFFYDKEQGDIMLPVLTHQAMSNRRAFFQLNEVLDGEVQSRTDNEPRLNGCEGPVAVIFWNEDPYLNTGVAQEFHKVFLNSALHSVNQAAHYVQLDKPEEVAAIILSSTTE